MHVAKLALRSFWCLLLEADLVWQAMSAMVHLETPHVNVLSKVDLLPNKVTCVVTAAELPVMAFIHILSNPVYHLQEVLDRFLVPDGLDLMHSLSKSTAPRFRKLNE